MLQKCHKDRSYLVEWLWMALLFLSTLLKDSGLLNDEYMFMHAGQDIFEQKWVNRHCNRQWHAVISPVRVLFWVDTNLATACHLHREYQSLGMQLNYSVRIRGTSGIQWQRWCTSDTACFIGVKLILYFPKRRSALGSWRIFSLVPFNFQVVLQFKRSFMKLRNVQVKLSK